MDSQEINGLSLIANIFSKNRFYKIQREKFL